jgi:hypothetical protein
MAEQRRVVFGNRTASERLPDWASTGVVIIEWLHRQGLWAEVTDRLKVQREGGYAGIDAFMFLTYYFTSGLDVGVKEFSEQAREHHKQLAAVGDRQRLPTQSSMSRILAAVETERARTFGSWLLREAPGVIDVLQHPSVLTRDAMGAGWHIFDWDPTVTTLRQRALPVIDGTPDGRRRSADLAEPGYSGRKRGDVQFSRATLQHAGSGLWLGIEMAPGNGAQRAAFQSGIQQVVATCEHAEVPLDRVILRADGVAGNVPHITACVEGGVHYITRLAHYQLLQDKNVVGHLNEAAWFEVPSSGSGPVRQAADLGRVFLEPAPDSVKADGSVFEPIETRIVVSRFPCFEDGRGAGVTLDGWHYELYGTDLSPEAWPEAEIVAGYYGRCGQENRFLQEDRELGLDRIFSYHLPGQQLATLIGLFVWNFFICRGMELARPPEDLPEQPIEECSPVPETPRLPEVGPAEPAAPNDAVVADGTSRANTERSSSADAAPAPSSDAEPPSAANDSWPPGTARPFLMAKLDEVDWERVLDKHGDWEWTAELGGLLCPADALLPFVRVENVGSRIRARFKADWGTCDSCEFRRTCTRSDDPQYRKDVRLTIPSPHAEPLLAIWSNAASELRTSKSRSKRQYNARTRWRQRSPIWRIKPLSWQPPDEPLARSMFAVAPPMLLPAELRKISRRITRRIEVHVSIEPPAAQPKLSPVLAYSAAERQKRRLSWEERLRWNALPEDARVETQLLGAGAVEHLLTPVPDDAELLAISA